MGFILSGSHIKITVIQCLDSSYSICNASNGYRIDKIEETFLV